VSREGIIEIETALAYASNAGNFRLQISDLMEEQASVRPRAEAEKEKTNSGTEPEIMRF